jgi:hypothetical protein
MAIIQARVVIVVMTGNHIKVMAVSVDLGWMIVVVANPMISETRMMETVATVSSAVTVPRRETVASSVTCVAALTISGRIGVIAT